MQIKGVKSTMVETCSHYINEFKILLVAKQRAFSWVYRQSIWMLSRYTIYGKFYLSF